jgi:hypothetical protein
LASTPNAVARTDAGILAAMRACAIDGSRSVHLGTNGTAIRDPRPAVVLTPCVTDASGTESPTQNDALDMMATNAGDPIGLSIASLDVRSRT